MIKVNLLPFKRKSKKKPVPAFLISGALLLVVVIIGLTYWMYYLKSEVSTLKVQKASNEKKIKALEVKIKDVKDFEKRNKTLNDRKGIIRQLKKDQSLPVRILDEMSRRLTEAIWLVSMSISGEKLSIAGIGYTNSDIVVFVQNLKASALFDDVYLHSTNRSSLGKESIFKFNITMKIVK